MTILRKLATPLILIATASAVLAEPAREPSSASVGISTRSLLELQRSGKQAGPELPVLGAASVLAYQRYLESHKHPIPVTYSSASTGASSGSQAK
jgi:hypothetical protein